MFKLTIVFAVVVIFCCCLATGFSQSSGSPSSQQGSSGGQAQAASPKKVRVLNPAGGRVYRLLRNSGNMADDDDMFLDEDNLQKRTFDDYGHMRFGKRQTGGRDFDDYGHMRFGKRQGGQTDDYGIGLRFGK